MPVLRLLRLLLWYVDASHSKCACDTRCTIRASANLGSSTSEAAQPCIFIWPLTFALVSLPWPPIFWSCAFALFRQKRTCCKPPAPNTRYLVASAMLDTGAQRQSPVISTVNYSGSMRLAASCLLLRLTVCIRIICIHKHTHLHTCTHTLSLRLALSLTHSLTHSLSHSLARALSLSLSHTHTHTGGMPELCLCLQPAASTRSPRTRTTKSR